MKRLLAYFTLLAVAMLMLSGGTLNSTGTVGAKLKSVLTKQTKSEIVYFKSMNIGAGRTAAFAIVRRSQYDGDVWFVNSSGARRLMKGLMFPPDDKEPETPCFWTVDGTKIFKCESCATVNSSSFAWYIKNDKPVKLADTGMELSYCGNGQFETDDDEYDNNYSDGIGTGHTDKTYYLYWTSHGLREYGGIKITQQKLLQIKGTRAVFNVLKQAGKKIGTIYYRGNHMININYYAGSKNDRTFDNVTLLYKNNAVTLPVVVWNNPASSGPKAFTAKSLIDYSYGGIYKAALFSKIASYPSKFPAD